MAERMRRHRFLPAAALHGYRERSGLDIFRGERQIAVARHQRYGIFRQQGGRPVRWRKFMRLKQLIAAALVAGLGVAGTSGAVAQETPFQPVAIVNDVPITGFDLGQRAQILLALGFPPSDQEGLRQEALNQLIDERLKLQATRDMNIPITPEMIEAGVEAFAEQTGMSADGFRARLKAQGVSDQALNDMARAEIEIGRAHV